MTDKELTFYTDCQTLSNLHGKRGEKLTVCHFKKKDGTFLAYADLYQEIIHLFTNNRVSIIKIKGHSPVITG